MKKYITGLAFIITMGLTHIGYTQTIYKIHDTETVHMKLTGTSTLHDWEMVANRATGTAQFIFASIDEKELTGIQSLTFTLAVADLKSDSKGMDKNAYKALKSDEYKNIQYQLSSSTMSPEKGGYLLKTKGRLTVAGCTKNVAMDIHVVVNENNTVTCKGTYELKMTDYEVEPPSFMFGVMKTGDATTLDFAVTYVN